MNQLDTNKKNKESKQDKILLMLLPFWYPMIPPLGIACLHSFLAPHGFDIRKVDATVEKSFMEINDEYFDALSQYIPENKRSNFYNVGNDMLREQMMAHIHFTCENEYIELVKDLFQKNFYAGIDSPQATRLKEILDDFYGRLKTYILRLMADENPGVVGISAFKGTLPATLYAFRLIKENYPQVKTVMGGGVFSDYLNPGSPDWERFLEKTPFIDKMIIGEGEALFLKYLKGELPADQKVYTLQDIGEKPLDISTLGVPDFSGFGLDDYPMLAAYTSRSCPFQCKFCSETVQWGNYRKKKARQVADEMVELSGKHGKRLFLMSDSLLNPIINELAGELLKTDPPLYWDSCIRIDEHACDIEYPFKWRRAGFYRARLGVESGSLRVLELMNKKITLEQIKIAVRNLALAGIKTTTFWVIGFPGETGEDFQQTLDLIEELKDDIYQAEFNTFQYYDSGQVNSGQWGQGSGLLYPEAAADMLVLQTRVLNVPPLRQESYERLNRVCEHCKKLGIPNPYSLYDIHLADERWKKLHKHAVPSLLEIRDNKRYIDECRHVKDVFAAGNTQEIEGDWGF